MFHYRRRRLFRVHLFLALVSWKSRRKREKRAFLRRRQPSNGASATGSSTSSISEPTRIRTLTSYLCHSVSHAVLWIKLETRKSNQLAKLNSAAALVKSFDLWRSPCCQLWKFAFSLLFIWTYVIMTNQIWNSSRYMTKMHICTVHNLFTLERAVNWIYSLKLLILILQT